MDRKVLGSQVVQVGLRAKQSMHAGWQTERARKENRGQTRRQGVKQELLKSPCLVEGCRRMHQSFQGLCCTGLAGSAGMLSQLSAPPSLFSQAWLRSN